MRKLCMFVSIVVASAAWEELAASNPPANRRGHSSVSDCILKGLDIFYLSVVAT